MTHPLPPRFILWRREWNEAAGKWNKTPCDHQGANIDPHDSSQWRSHADALRYATFDESRPSAPFGVGWVLNGDGCFFLDLDNCGPNWTAEATAIYQSFTGALGEVSTSGKGLHIFGRCDPAQLAGRRNKWDGDKEFYTTKRFVALSQHQMHVIGGGDPTDKDWTDQLRRLVPEREHLGELPDGRAEEYTGPDDDAALLRLAMASKSSANAFGAGVSFADLWEARAEPLARQYPSYGGVVGQFDHSSADAALMGHLAFWTGRDMPRMDRLFRQSALMRDKYEKRADYRRDTVGNAARMCKKVYDSPRKVERFPVPGTGGAVVSAVGETYLTIPEMIEWFKGCVYVRDVHRVLVPDGAMLKPEQFNATYGGKMFQIMPDGTKPTRKAFEALTECIAHRFPAAVRPVFRPREPSGVILPDGGINTYVAPGVDMRAGDVSPFTDFLARLLPDPRDREILVSYMAAVVQNPGVKFQWAPVLQGTEGNGKTLAASCVAYAVGRRYSWTPKPENLTSNFNAYLEGRLFIIVEEIHMGGRREMLDALKPMITNVELEVELKGVDSRMIENFTNWFFCTNHRDAVIKSRNDRRYAVFFTAQQSAADLARDGMGGNYFPALYQWLRDGGYACVAQWLCDYQIKPELNPADLCHRAPDTSSTEAAIAVSVGGIEAEITEAVDAGEVGFRGGWISTFHLERLMRERGFRIGRARVGQILTDMGYVTSFRAPRAVMREDAKRPVLWSNGARGGFEEYLRAQGSGYD